MRSKPLTSLVSNVLYIGLSTLSSEGKAQNSKKLWQHLFGSAATLHIYLHILSLVAPLKRSTPSRQEKYSFRARELLPLPQFGTPFLPCNFLSPTRRIIMQQAFLSQRCTSATPATDEQQNQEERHTAECKGYPCTLGEACHKEGEERITT